MTPQTSAIKLSLREDATPSMPLSCDSAMMIAAALVKPTTTGCDRKLTIAPSLHTPIASSNMPTISVSNTASAINCSEDGAANCARVAPVSSDTMATGPVASWRDEPHNAPTMTGRNAA